MEYRKFRLLNSQNKIFELTDKNFKVFASKPSGLGFSKTVSIYRLGDENLIPYSMLNLDQITFELLFYDEKLADKYQKYDDFISFISYKPIYLLYQKPNSFNWYRRRIESMSLSKTEVSTDGMLHCNYNVQTLTFWEDNNINEIVVTTPEPDVEEGKIYPLTYPFAYTGSSLTNIQLRSVGFLDSPLQITIDGTTTDPQYILYDENNEIYGRGKFIGTFDRLYINSSESDEQLELKRNDLILSNPLSYQDLTVGSPNEIYVTFLKLKLGGSRISFILGDAFEGSVRIQWRNRYATI